MAYQVITPNRDPLYLEFMSNQVSSHKPFEEYEHLYKCSGLWNNGCRECTIAELKRMIDWAAMCEYYETKDGKSLYVRGYSQNDMW